MEVCYFFTVATSYLCVILLLCKYLHVHLCVRCESDCTVLIYLFIFLSSVLACHWKRSLFARTELHIPKKILILLVVVTLLKKKNNFTFLRYHMKPALELIVTLLTHWVVFFSNTKVCNKTLVFVFGKNQTAEVSVQHDRHIIKNRHFTIPSSMFWLLKGVLLSVVWL